MGLWASLVAWLVFDFSGITLRFVFGFGAATTILLAAFQSVRMALWESIQKFREAWNDFENPMR